jgi:hypothetical protein
VVRLGGSGAARATGGWRVEPEGRRPGHRGGQRPTELACGGGRRSAVSRVEEEDCRRGHMEEEDGRRGSRVEEDGQGAHTRRKNG